MSVMTGSETSKCIQVLFSSHVGTGSGEQDCDANFSVIFLISPIVAGVTKVIEALVTRFDVITGDVGAFKYRILRYFFHIVHKY